MVKVKVEYMNGKISIYDVEYPTAYIAKIIESENGLLEDQKSVMAIYASDKLIAKFKNGFLNELVMEYAHKKKLKSTTSAGCDGFAVISSELRNIKDKIKADEDWNEYQAEIMHAQKMIKENMWVMDHTGGNVQITYKQIYI